ncbi:hypothetical protein [Deinococcus sp. SL84]|uniref:hypothetical protein n=1 Tax=Deinococcus sp. SL84 TaxID=2994663 RepID=UPI002273BEF2|nr:hypothetical protein [Deinococcus sp. SL84]MCY1703826.1 hypothetical protein [Deinococcus sp. SL84]
MSTMLKGSVNDVPASAPVSPEGLSEFDAQTHVLLGLPGCARCGSAAYGSVLACWPCLEQDMREQAQAEVARRVRERGALLARLSPAPAVPARPRVFRWNRRASP